MKTRIFRTLREFSFYFPEIVWYSVLTFVIYFKLWRSYFTQDEWYYFSLFHQYADSPLGFVSVFVDQFRNIAAWGIHITPLWNSLFFLQYQLFGLTYQYWALTAMFLHIVAAFSVSLFIYKLSKSRMSAIITGTFFVIQSSHTEAVTWANTNVQTQIPVILISLGLLLWLLWLEKEKRIFALYSLSLFFLSLLIRENVSGMFFILPVLTFIQGNTTKIKSSIRIVGASFILYITFRFGLIRILAAQQGEDITKSIPSGIFDIGSFLFRLPFYTAKTLVHQIVGSDSIRYLSELFTSWNYPLSYGADRDISGPVYTTFIHSAGSDIVMILLAFPLLLSLWLLWSYFRRIKQKHIANLIPFSLAFIGASLAAWVLLVPYLLTLMPSMTYVPSRQLYLTSIGTGLLTSVFITFLFHGRKKFNGIIRSVCILGIIVVLVWFGRELVLARNVIVSEVIHFGEQRRVITDYMKAVYPTIPDTAVFYVTSNSSYFGFPASTVPFQTNFGATILEMYRKEKDFSPYFYQTEHFIAKGPLGQGYINQNGKAFGYYYDGAALLNDMTTFELSTDSVFSFHYDGDSRVLQVTTEDIRKLIEKERMYVRESALWVQFGKGMYPVWFLVPPGFTAEAAIADEKTEFVFRSKRSGLVVYSVSYYQNTGKTQMDEFIEMYEKKNIEQIQRDDTVLYLNTLRRIRGIIVHRDNTVAYFFRHPTTYNIVVVTADNSAKDNQYPPELFFWNLRLE